MHNQVLKRKKEVLLGKIYTTIVWKKCLSMETRAILIRIGRDVYQNLIKSIKCHLIKILAQYKVNLVNSEIYQMLLAVMINHLNILYSKTNRQQIKT